MTSSHRRQLVCLLTIAALARITAVWLVYKSQPIDFFWDSGFESTRIAASLSNGLGFSSPFAVPSGPTAWVPPVYPFLTALAFKCFGVYSKASLAALLAFNVGSAVITTALLFFIGVRCFVPIVAWAGTLLWAVYQDSAVMPCRLWESNLSAMIVTASILLFLLLRESPKDKRFWIAAGIMWSFAALTNTGLLILLPLWLLALLFQHPRAVLGGGLIAGSILLLLIAPWEIRNFTAFHAFVPIRGNFGEELWAGNHPGVEGPIDESIQPTRNASELKRYLRMGEVAYVRDCQRSATAYIMADPARFAAHSAARILSFWSTRRVVAPLACGIMALVSFCGLGLFFFRDDARAAIPFASALILYPLPYYVTHAQNVFRHPIEPVMCMLAAYGALSTLYGRKRSSNPSGLPAEVMLPSGSEQAHSSASATQ